MVGLCQAFILQGFKFLPLETFSRFNRIYGEMSKKHIFVDLGIALIITITRYGNTIQNDTTMISQLTKYVTRFTSLVFCRALQILKLYKI